MKLLKRTSKNLTPLILLILAGESVFFLPFVIPRIFRPSVLSVYEISNTELGSYFSVYGIVAMISYFIGGPLADKFQPKLLMGLGLVLTALGGFSVAIYPVLMGVFLYGYWGCTTILLFWAALIKSTRLWGGEHTQGRAFGLLEGGRGALAAILGTIGAAVFATQMEATNLDNVASFKLVLIVTSSITFFAGVLVYLGLPTVTSKNLAGSAFEMKGLKSVMKNKRLWLQSIIVICAYVGYKITDDFSLYAQDVLGFDEVQSSMVGTGAIWLRPLFALAAGFLADKISGIRVISISFLISGIGGILLFSGIISGGAAVSLLNLSAISAGIYGIRGVYFAIMGDAQISLAHTGTAVGVISVVGYTPDVFVSPLMGYLLDNYPGILGHQYVFGVLALFSICGLLVSLIFRKTKEVA